MWLACLPWRFKHRANVYLQDDISTEYLCVAWCGLWYVRSSSFLLHYPKSTNLLHFTAKILSYSADILNNSTSRFFVSYLLTGGWSLIRCRYSCGLVHIGHLYGLVIHSNLCTDVLSMGWLGNWFPDGRKYDLCDVC